MITMVEKKGLISEEDYVKVKKWLRQIFAYFDIIVLDEGDKFIVMRNKNEIISFEYVKAWPVGKIIIHVPKHSIQHRVSKISIFKQSVGYWVRRLKREGDLVLNQKGFNAFTDYLVEKLRNKQVPLVLVKERQDKVCYERHYIGKSFTFGILVAKRTGGLLFTTTIGPEKKWDIGRLIGLAEKIYNNLEFLPW